MIKQSVGGCEIEFNTEMTELAVSDGPGSLRVNPAKLKESAARRGISDNELLECLVQQEQKMSEEMNRAVNAQKVTGEG